MKKRFIISLFFLLNITFVANANVVSDYYTNLFQVWGIDADNIETSTIAINRKDTFLALTSELQGADQEVIIHEDYSTVVIICDKPYVFSENISCTNASIYAPSNSLVNIANYTNKNNLVIFNYPLNNRSTLIIPEIYLVSPTYSDVLRKYINALSRSHSVLLEKEEVVSAGISPFLERNSLFLDILLYATVVFVFFIIFKPLGNFIFSSPKKLLSFDTYFSILNNFMTKLKKYSWIYMHLLVVSLLSNIALFYLMFERENTAIDAKFINSFVLSKLTFSSVMNAQDSVNSIELGMSISIWIFIICLIILVAPTVLLVFQEVLVKYTFVRWNIKNVVIKIIVMTALVLLVYLLISPKIQFFMLYIVTLHVVIWYMYYQHDKHDLRLLLTPIEKVVFFALVFLTIVLRMFNFTISSIYVPLFNSNIVVLPAKVNVEDKLFQKYLINPDFPVLVNNYLLYHPDFSKVQNANIRDFNPSHTFMLLAREPSTILKEITKNEVLRNWLKANLDNSNDTGTMFFTDSLNYNYEELALKISYECNKAYPSSKYVLEIYNDQKVSIYSNVNTKDIFNFPGCYPGYSSSYILPIDIEYLPREPLAFEFKSHKTETQLDNINIQLLKNGAPVTAYHIPSYANRRLMFTNISSDGKISDDLLTFYTSNSREEQTFSHGLGEEFDLASAINSLLTLKLLDTSLTIWSLYDGVLLHSDFITSN